MNRPSTWHDRVKKILCMMNEADCASVERCAVWTGPSAPDAGRPGAGKISIQFNSSDQRDLLIREQADFF